MLQVSRTRSGRTLRGALAWCFLIAAAAQPAAAQDDSGMASRMILEIQQMREEVRELRGLVEAQAQEIENLKRRQRDQYLDLDRRLGELRSGDAGLNQAPAPGSRDDSRDNGPGRNQDDGYNDRFANRDDNRQTNPQPNRQDRPEDNRASGRDQMASGGSPTNRPESAEPPDTRQMELPEVRPPQTEQPEVVTLDDPGSGEGRQLREPTQAEQQAYDQAFRALRETRYADAAEGFDAFLRDHPESSYAPNALYWLGEVYYVTRDFETALAQFERLQAIYPDSGKKADALLKIGFSHYELGNWDRARAALEQVISDFPGSTYSRLAENRLRTMRLEGHL